MVIGVTNSVNGKKLGLLPNGAHPIVAMHTAEARKVCAATAYAVPSLSSAEVHVGFVDLNIAVTGAGSLLGEVDLDQLPAKELQPKWADTATYTHSK